MSHQETYIDGVWYPSVTTILGDRPKPWLDKWREKWGVLADRKCDIAKNVGDKFHVIAEQLAKGELVLPPENKRLREMLTQFDTWLVDSGFQCKETELHVISREYVYAGTFDAVGFTRGEKKIAVFDWKTSSAIYPEYAEQLAAYAQAYKEQTGIEIKRGVIVHVSKDKPDHKLTVKEYVLNKRLFNKFLKRLKEFREHNDPIIRREDIA